MYSERTSQGLKPFQRRHPFPCSFPRDTMSQEKSKQEEEIIIPLPVCIWKIMSRVERKSYMMNPHGASLRFMLFVRGAAGGSRGVSGNLLVQFWYQTLAEK